MGDRLTIQVTSDINQVTCKRCLATGTAQKRKPGRPSEGKQKRNVSFDPDVWEKVKDLGWGERSKIVNQALRRYLHKPL
jgi:uncharacterized protein (DUF4415 family)